MKKSKLQNVSVVDNTGIRVQPSMLIGDYAGYASGDILDANATSQLISNKIQNSGSNQTSGDIENDIEELQQGLDTFRDRIDGTILKLRGDIGTLENIAYRQNLRTEALEEKALPDTIIVEEDGLYQSKGFDVYPLSHPDLSTQPSILPQRFGKEKIYEVLVTTKQENIATIPSVGLYMPTYEQSGPLDVLQDLPQYTGGEVDAMRVILYAVSKQLVFTINKGDAVTSSVGWFRITNPSYQLGTLTNAQRLIMVYPFYDDAEAYPGCFRYFAYKQIDSEDNLLYAKVTSDNGEVENTTLDEIANDGVNVYNTTLDPEIPSTATVIEASSFNSEACVPAICKKENGKWNITNNEGITPDFTLVRYIGEAEDYYYENSSSSSDSGHTIIKSFDVPLSQGSTTEWPTEMNVPDIWGNDSQMFETGQIIGKVIVNNEEYHDLIVGNNGSSVGINTYDWSVLQLELYRVSGHLPGVTTYPAYDIHIDFYAL